MMLPCSGEHSGGETTNIRRLPRQTNPDLAARAGLSLWVLGEVLNSELFDEHYYRSMYPDIVGTNDDPLEHFLISGRLEDRRPSAIFDPAAYRSANPDITETGLDAFTHFILIGQGLGAPLSPAELIAPRPDHMRVLDSTTKNLIVFLTPGRELVSGGVLSIASIYRETGAMADIHGATVVLCAVPGDDPSFLKYSWFKNDNYLLDFVAVLRRCRHLEHLQVHVPEYAANQVFQWLKGLPPVWLRGVHIHINILLQNIDLAEGQDFAKFANFGKVTATTAHEAYGSLATRQALGIPVHRLSVYFGPDQYTATEYFSKEPILVVSHDDHPLKTLVLEKLALVRPDLEIVVVQGLLYEEYKNLIRRAKWSLTFGEGLDGYFAETIFSGGNAFAVFNDRFFTTDFAALETVYPSWEVLVERFVEDLQRLDESEQYNRCWKQSYDLLASIYSTEKFRMNLLAFFRRQYTFP